MKNKSAESTRCEMIQQVYMPSGKLIFQTTMPEMMYSEETARNMNRAGYTVKMNGKKWPGGRK